LFPAGGFPAGGFPAGAGEGVGVAGGVPANSLLYSPSARNLIFSISSKIRAFVFLSLAAAGFLAAGVLGFHPLGLLSAPPVHF
jgi:hypothetical protein